MTTHGERHLERMIDRRHFVRVLMRGAVAVLVFAAIMPILGEFLSRIPYGWAAMVSRPFFSFRSELAWGGTCLVTAAVLYLLQRRLARWIVPIDRGRCPECDYRVTGATADRCPECGLPLPAWLRSDDSAG